MSLISKSLHFKSTKGKLLWCTDPHINHRPSWSPAPWESRGFPSGDAHDAWFKDQWYTHVDDNTTVFVLGDVVFKDDKGEFFRQFTSWPGRKLFVWGNHFSGQRQIYFEAIQRTLEDWGCGATGAGLPLPEIYPIRYNDLTFVGDSLHAWIDGQSIWMSHYAPLIWPEMGNGGWAIAAHSHGSCAQLNPDHKDGLILDAGVDNAIKLNQTPFLSWSEVSAIMGRKRKKVIDHHRGDVPGQ